MATSIFIAKILGVAYITIGLGFILNSSHYRKAYQNWLKDSGFIFLMGILTIVVSTIWVDAHNVWTGPWWVILISIFGWIALIKGISLLILPNTLAEFSKKILNTNSLLTIAGTFCVVIGIIFGYYGFF